MLSELITSKTRLKLLIKFYLNTGTKSYLRLLERELNESPNTIRIELKKLELLHIIKSSKEGNRKQFQINTDHYLFYDMRKIILKDIGLYAIKTLIKEKDHNIEKVFVIGEYANGIESWIFDIVFVGENIDHVQLNKNISLVEALTEKRIRYIIVNEFYEKEFINNINYFAL